MKDPKANFNNGKLEATSLESNQDSPSFDRVFHSEVAFSSPFWISHLDKYIDQQGDLWTEEEINEFARMEKKLKDSLPEMGFYERMEIFPEAKEIAITQITNTLNKLKEKSQTHYYWFIEKIVNNASHKDQPALITYINEIVEQEQDEIFKLVYQLKWLKGDTKNTLDIEKAKQVPITTFLKVNKNHKTRCLFHEDTDPSMHVYPKTNTFYCFVCNTSGDVINIVQQLKKCSFLEAVKLLLQ